MLALRTERGLDIEKFNKEFNADFLSDYKSALSKKGKFMDVDEKTAKIKEEYIFVQNDIIMEFMK